MLDGADLSHANLMGAYFFPENPVPGSFNVDAADMRGTDRFSNPGGINTIMYDGRINGLSLEESRSLVVRNYRATPPISVLVEEYAFTDATGRLELLFDTNEWHSLISFEPGIPVVRDGTLELAFAKDVDIAAQIGRTFHIFDWTGVEPTGAFTVASDYPWDVSDLYTTGEVTLLLPGDTNGDQVVSILDLNNVRNNFGLSGAGILGDTNGNAVVDIVDLTNVRNFFGVATAQAVPEPSSFILLIAAAVALVAAPARFKRSTRLHQALTLN